MAAPQLPPKSQTPLQTIRFLEETRIPEDLADLSDKSSYLRQVIDYCEQTYVSAPNKLETVRVGFVFPGGRMGFSPRFPSVRCLQAHLSADSSSRGLSAD
eukprot:scaffold13_cov241-Pinguiococcus_pyrenoidosus.AAC.3